MKTPLLITLLLAVTLSFPAMAGPTSFRSEPKHDNHSSQHKSYRHERYRYKYDDRYHDRHRVKREYRYSRKHHHEPDFLYVLPKGSRIVIINGAEYYRWQKRHYLSGYYKGDKVFIAVGL